MSEKLFNFGKVILLLVLLLFSDKEFYLFGKNFSDCLIVIYM